MGFGTLSFLKNLNDLNSGKFFFIVVLFFLLQIPSTFSKSSLDEKKTLKEYWTYIKDFSKELCKGGDHKFRELYGKYQRNNFFVPLNGDGTEIDIDSINDNLELMRVKNSWLIELEKKAKININSKWYASVKKKIKRLEKNLKKFLVIKEDENVFNKKSEEQKKEIVSAIKREYGTLIEQLFVWENFQETDYFETRKEYEANKTSKLYLKRKIVEDGMPSWGDQDLFLRALLKGTKQRMEGFENDFSDDVLYDLDRLLKMIESRCLISKKEILQGLKDWKEKSINHYKFYQDIISNVSRDQIEEFKKDRESLIKFNDKKQKKIYEFWQDKDEIFQYLYVQDMILFSEVGILDDQFSFNRNAISQIIQNRSKMEEYNKLDSKQTLYKLIKSDSELFSKTNSEKNKWLNLLLRKGEFSFTYFYSTLSPHLYCSDLSKRGKKIRNKNLHIAFSRFVHPENEFKAIRFFSRRSMLAGIDMSKIWNELTALDTEIGEEVSKKLLIKLERDFKQHKKTRNKIFYLKSIDSEKFNNQKVHLYEWKNGHKYFVHNDKKETKFYHFRDKNAFLYLKPNK